MIRRDLLCLSTAPAAFSRSRVSFPAFPLSPFRSGTVSASRILWRKHLCVEVFGRASLNAIPFPHRRQLTFPPNAFLLTCALGPLAPTNSRILTCLAIRSRSTILSAEEVSGGWSDDGVWGEGSECGGQVDDMLDSFPSNTGVETLASCELRKEGDDDKRPLKNRGSWRRLSRRFSFSLFPPSPNQPLVRS